MSFSFFQSQWEIYDLDHYILMSYFFQLNQRKEKKAGSSAVKRRERTSAKGEFAYETMAQKTLRSGGKRAKMNLPGEGASQGNDFSRLHVMELTTSLVLLNDSDSIKG